MTRLLLVTHYYAEHRGGVELVAAELAKRLARRGFTITWAATDEGPTAESSDWIRLPLWAWNGSERRLGVPYPLPSLGSLRKLQRAVRACDVVHLHDALYAANIAAFLFAKWYGRPVVVTQHIGLIPYRNPLLRGLMALANATVGRLVLGGATRCVFIGRQVEAYFRARIRFRRPPLFIANGCDSAFAPMSGSERLRLRCGSEQPCLLFVGRFVERKGLNLVRQLAEHWPSVRFVLAGWGPLDPRGWGLANVECVGSRSRAELLPLYAAADLLLLPSVGEGFPLVVQEAMVCGTPALVTPTTAAASPDAAELLYTADSTVDALDAALRTILADRAELLSRRSRVAAFARQVWDWERCADRYASLLRPDHCCRKSLYGISS